MKKVTTTDSNKKAIKSTSGDDKKAPKSIKVIIKEEDLAVVTGGAESIHVFRSL